MFRNYLGQSIVVLFTLASFFFVLIFLIGVADNTKTNNSIQNQVPLQQSQVDRWGTIPGLLDYVYTRSATIYSRQTYSATKLNMNIEGPYELIVSRNFENPEWVPTKACIDYSMDYSYSGLTQTQLDTIQLMPNLAALSVWYQKTHKPTWWQAWQALTQVSNLMFTSNMLTRYYAYNAYLYVFYDQTLVNQGVLAGLSPADQITVYTDDKFGMNSVFKLTFWVLANEGGATSTAWTSIVTYYAAKGIDMTSVMPQICGPQSIIQFIVQEQKIILLNEKAFDQKVALDDQYMTQIQWGQNSILGNATFMMTGVPTLSSIADPIFDNVFVAQPEFGSYLQNQGLGYLNLTNAQVKLIFNPSTSDYQTLLNPDNMRAFYKQYGEGSYVNIFQRFGFTSNAQVDQFYNYLGYLIEQSLHQGAPLENSAFGELVERTINQTYATLNSTLQLEVTVRNMAQNINGSPGILDCNYFVGQAVTDPIQLASICDVYNFSDVEQLKLFTNATWYKNTTTASYGGFYTDQLQLLTGMDDAQVATFFDTTITTSFGSYVVTYCNKVALQYLCASTANCTSIELANLQWGSSGVTNNPINNDPNYTPKQTTCAKWGSWPVYGCDIAVEYYYWSQDKVALTSTAVTRIQSNVIDYYGLLNLFNSMKLMNAYFTQNQTTLSTFETNLQITGANFPQNMIFMVQGWLLEGAWTNNTSEQLLFGWNSTIADKAIGGDYWQGADFSISSYMTPIINDQIGPVANAPYGLYSGSFSVDNVSVYRLLNGEAYLNKLTKVWNGTYYSNVPQQPNDAVSNTDAMWFNTASNGIQFPPDMNTDSVTVYDDRLININTYNYEKTSQLSPTVLDIQQYLGEWSGGLDVGFTFNMPFYEHSLGCGDCQNTTQELATNYQIQIQGHNYVKASTNSTFDLGVNPDTGFMQYQNKESSMIMLLEYYTNSSQSLQPSAFQPFPIPDLIPLIGIQVPVYDFKEYLNADSTQYLAQVGYISDNASKVRTQTIWMIVLTSIFFIAGVIAAIVYKSKQSKSEFGSDVAQVEADENSHLID